VANADLPGFDSDARNFIAALCRYHRKNMPKSSQDEFARLSTEEQNALLHLIPLLRIADSLDRSHRQVVRSVEAERGLPGWRATISL
jgi:exopolyphosphatase/guanosine-5'-triphosphate,3'-diphosphate pyrophosphatase